VERNAYNEFWQENHLEDIHVEHRGDEDNVKMELGIVISVAVV